ncbi:Lrp/AsnC family transcriptional regulator [Agromyces sp. NPDC058064]|uniref:Lrp/AsnC family transcriptional regulator n=1 Tax=Agromyces sp. NPDC058064 TaxID=3346322 RepID=UPI0036DF4C7D
MQDISLDDLDLQLIHALQLEPRVAWTSLASVLGSDPVTLSRRWERISTAGLAWTSTIPGAVGRSAETAGALVEFVCEPGRVLATADVAAADPAIYSIDLTAGQRDVLATLVTADDRELAEYALDRLGAIPGVRSIRTHVVHEVLRLGSDWSVQSLTPAQQARIPLPRPPRTGSAKRVDPELARALRQRLGFDARASYTDLGRDLGYSAQRVADAVARLRAEGDLVFRTDVAAPYSNWPLAAWFFIQAPASTLDAARESLSTMASLQYAAITSGPANLIVAAGARAKPEVLQIEAELEQRLPRSRIADRSMVLRVHKHLGRLLDPRGLAGDRAVPLP